MSLVPFSELIAAAEQGQYAVGYFESWNLESLLAVADAAEATRSPVILGFSGICLPSPERMVKEKLGVYAGLGLETCRSLAVPACLLFNESPDLDWVLESIDLGFNLVMFSDDRLGWEEQLERIVRVVGKARAAGAAVEAELAALPGILGELTAVPTEARLDDPASARAFVERSGVDALAVNIGQVHIHGRSQVHLDLSRLAELRAAVPVPLVLHGATSVLPADLAAAVQGGVRKINVGSILKRTFFETLRRASNQVGEAYNPYQVMGSGLSGDVLSVARLALQRVVEDYMRLFGSAGKAG
jgi:fructose/tagatose bisphosphate aldolase